ncbi:MAG: ribose 5-phosphate isomerase B [Candidatus Omnitrophota bacterium]
MRIAIGSDHGGFQLKEKLIKFLLKKRYNVKDFGTHNPESCDYPKIGSKVAEGVSRGRFERGILICKTGIGFGIVANKFPGVRTVVAYQAKVATLSRQHNDTNVLALGAKFVNSEKAEKIVMAWLTTPFEGGRHLRRVDQINALEKKLLKES